MVQIKMIRDIKKYKRMKYLEYKGLSQGWLTLREAAEYKSVRISTIFNTTRLTMSENSKIKFDEDYKKWKPRTMVNLC